jgi:hypothetical protein
LAVEITFDPYDALPFLSYGEDSGSDFELDRCLSLMHFVEAEKFIGVDDQYRRFIMRIEDKEDFLLETAGVSQARRRQDWTHVRERLIRAGAWMQLVQNKDSMLHLLMDDQLVCDLAPINEAFDSIRQRLLRCEDDPLRQVLVAGNTTFDDRDAVFGMLDSMFANRQPDELLIGTEPGVARFVASYARAHYIPLRVVGRGGETDSIEEAMRFASHVFVATHTGEGSSFADSCYAAAIESGKIAHTVQLESLCS